MIGRRVHPKPGEDWVYAMQPGDYGCGPTGDWFCRTPNGQLGNLGGHQVTEHEDGTITVSPSILVTGGEQWHGFLERGIWRSC